MGEAQLRLANFSHAEESLHVALQLARDCEAPYERALTEIAMAELHLAAGKHLLSANQLGSRTGTLERLGETSANA